MNFLSRAPQINYANPREPLSHVRQITNYSVRLSRALYQYLNKIHDEYMRHMKKKYMTSMHKSYIKARRGFEIIESLEKSPALVSASQR